MVARFVLTGRRVLITGPAQGIGERIARLTAARGARLGLIGLQPDRLAALAEELGEGHHWAACDVTDQAGLDDAVASTVAALGGIDVAVANAGIATSGTVATAAVEDLVRTIDVNLNGVMRTVSATLPHLIDARGYALLISSVAAFTAMPGMAAYCAAKAGVEQFANVLRLEVRDRGVSVGTAHPIWTNTDLIRDFSEHVPSFEAARRALPWPLNSLVPVDACAEALVRAIERRQRTVYIPRSMAGVQALRTFLLSRLGERVTARITGGGGLVAQLEAEARAAQRASRSQP